MIMGRSKSETYLQISLDSVISYIRGDMNLKEAIEKLEQLGHDKKSATKVLRNTDRNNVFSFQTKSRLGDSSSEEDVGDKQTD
jgi:hypothetical protein|tara:strand:- start:141 stop:389 length:249 start_codon:yes stop_codon:yes gene_type:complete